MISPKLEPLGIFGMLLLSSQAIAIQAICMVEETDDGFHVLLANGHTIHLHGDDAAEFEKQTKLISQQIRYGQLNLGQNRG